MRTAGSPHAARGRALGWLLLPVALAAAVVAMRQYLPQHLPMFLRPPRADPGTEIAVGGREAPNPPLYKWKDAQGQWHITDKPPAGRAYETVRVDPNTNVIPAFVPETQSEPPPDDPE